ncbi:hypothetical protein BG621_05405 [Parasaccharibacter apium]|nr:hypothetical protein BG621_05405 [Parasaccharibacter apium]
MLAAVIIMGLMIIIGATALVGVIIYRVVHQSAVSTERPAATMMQSAVEPSSLSSVARLKVPRLPGEHVIMVSARQDGAFAVMLKDEQGGVRILLWSPEQARIIAELTLTAPSSP